MSHIDLGETYLRCELEQELHKLPYVEGSEAFVDAAIRMQAVEAADELGDVILEGPDAVIACMESSGADISFDKAHNLYGGVALCIINRYTGKCSASGTCTGREDMKARLERLGINEHQPNTQAEPVPLANMLAMQAALDVRR